jgi:hypothetical protein
MNKRETKKAYEAPALTVVSFKTEQGYVLSMLAGTWSGDSGDNAGTAGVSDYTEENNGNYFSW